MKTRKNPSCPVYDITPFTLLDFPDKTACIVWFSGCNMRCAYCHNPQMISAKGQHGIQDILNFLEKRRGLLEGVVLSGGEATTYNGLITFAREAKMMGYSVKLDTNGTRPAVVQSLLNENLLDYIALDYKAPPSAYKKVTGVKKFKEFEKTLSLLCVQNDVPFEVRTTVHTALMNEKDIQEIIDDLEEHHFSKTYYIQNCRTEHGKPTLGFLPPQERELDTSLLPIPSSFAIRLRNFS